MASDSSASTPMVLTPESTGNVSFESSSASPSSTAAAKKARRQTAFYPNMNAANKPVKPFSRSAAKRESVMALGSIEHLQHYFTKTGIAAKKNPFVGKPHHGLVPAIGGLAHIRTGPSIGSIQELQLPPSPAIPQNTRPAFPDVGKAYDVDPEYLLPGVIEDLIAVSNAWGFSPPNGPSTTNGPNPDLLAAGSPPSRHPRLEFDVLEVLKITTRAIRSTRNYIVSLPDEYTGTIRSNFRPTSLGPSFTKKATSSTSTSQSSSADPSNMIRRSALEVLTVLRELEENARLPLSDEAYDAQSDGSRHSGGGHSRMASPSEILDDDAESSAGGSVGRVDPDTSVTFLRVHGRDESVPVWDEESSDSEEEVEKKERWDDKLVLGNGWLYRQDITMTDVHKEKFVVGSYLDVVDAALFGGSKTREGKTERGWEKERKRLSEKDGSQKAKNRRVSAGDVEGRGLLGAFLQPGSSMGPKRRVSTGMLNMMNVVSLAEEPLHMDNIQEDEEEEDETVDDDNLPEWAKRSSFEDDDLGRAHAVIVEFLPAEFLHALQSPKASSREAFLTSLSSGQLLCMAYNACIRKSKKPWGYISKDGIHDILTLEKQGQGQAKDGTKAWTFRRSDNLRLWVGALKIRYLIPIYIPTHTLPLPVPAPGMPNPNNSSPGSNSPAMGSTPLSSPGLISRFPSSSSAAGSGEPPITFDTRIVAKRDDGWEDMLEGVLLKWVRKVVDEKRSGR
ncbi:hypothetical protein BDN72DRAFT_838226 [Pluteus cervinus]|uniref:Uncharacterized protein n=1 Tax=Pluteus cervinus TaxID=181527 RepID=A0ACD3AZ19_9AGAR|nr:hypothetical protein BDN72DRAFT_838226 [Pluteus cervinus]